MAAIIASAMPLLVALAIKVVGALLITALLVIPAAAARPFARSPEAMLGFGGHGRPASNLVISNGLELEIGWLPNLIVQSRNPDIQLGQPGHFEVPFYWPQEYKASV